MKEEGKSMLNKAFYTSRSRSFLGMMRKQVRPAVMIFVMLMLVIGVAYPLAVTGIAQLVFPHQANGSQIAQNGTVVGSELIGQPFNDSIYFWGRLSATPGYPYNASLSSGTNFGPNNPSLLGYGAGPVRGVASG